MSILLSITLAHSLFRSELHDPNQKCRLFCKTHGNGICYDNNCEGPMILCVDGSINTFYCAPGTVFNPRVLACDWPYCLPHDHPCYDPCPACGDLTEVCHRTVEVMRKP